jgi:hypothetical protein
MNHSGRRGICSRGNDRVFGALSLSRFHLLGRDRGVISGHEG